MFKKKVIALFLVLALFVSSILPVHAASVSGNIAPSGIVDMYEMDAEFEALPDRTRYTYVLRQPSSNYYFATKVKDTDTYQYSYDLNTDFVSIGGAGGSATDYHLDIYPAGRFYYRLPEDPSFYSDSDVLFTITVPVRLKTDTVTSSGTTSVYSTGPKNAPKFTFVFYDSDFNLISTSSGTCSLDSKSGDSTEDSFGLCTYRFSKAIPDDAFYVVPCIRFSHTTTRTSSSSYTCSYTQIKPEDMSCSIRFDVMETAETVDGVWTFRDDPTSSWFTYSYPVRFTCGGVTYDGLKFARTGSVYTIQYLYSGGGETVYIDGWFGDSKKTIDFGSVPQAVPSYFRTALTMAAQRVGDSPTANTGSICIKDYSGSLELFDLDSVKFPCSVAVESNGLSFTFSGDDTVSYFYEFGGTGNFVGCSLVPNDTMTRYTQGRTFTLTSSSTVYLHVEGNVSPDQPDDPDPSDPTDPVDPSEPDDNTDPTDPGGSGGSGDSGSGDSGSGDSADDLHGIGNGAVDDLTGAIPDYSEGFVLALQDFAGAFSYEGTACSFTLPAVTMPAISDKVPKFELIPSTEFDIEPLFELFPSKILLLVRSLLTGGLIVYCFKELYDTVSYFMTLKKGE